VLGDVLWRINGGRASVAAQLGYMQPTRAASESDQPGPLTRLFLCPAIPVDDSGDANGGRVGDLPLSTRNPLSSPFSLALPPAPCPESTQDRWTITGDEAVRLSVADEVWRVRMRRSVCVALFLHFVGYTSSVTPRRSSVPKRVRDASRCQRFVHSLRRLHSRASGQPRYALEALPPERTPKTG
jgi:hypothetical protein